MFFVFFFIRNFWEFRRHFPDLADNLYASLDASTQKALERERDGTASNGTSSMSASLRGSNTSLNSMPSSAISMYRFVCFCFVVLLDFGIFGQNVVARVYLFCLNRNIFYSSRVHRTTSSAGTTKSSHDQSIRCVEIKTVCLSRRIDLVLGCLQIVCCCSYCCHVMGGRRSKKKCYFV